MARALFSSRGLLSFVIVAILAGCAAPENPDDVDRTDGTTSGGDAGGMGQAAFYVRDAPADEFRSVFVTFDEVQVHMAGGEDGGETDTFTTTSATTMTTAPDDTTTTDTAAQNGTNTTTPTGTNATTPTDGSTEETSTTTTETGTMTDEGEGDAGWKTIVDQEQTIDLKAFQGGARAFLGAEDIEAGKYTQIRIFITEAWGEDAETGDRVEIEVPSDTLKIVRPWTVEDGMVTELTVDFDLNESLHQQGNDRWILRPTLKLEVTMGGPTDGFTPDEGTQTATATTTATTGTTAMETTQTTEFTGTTETATQSPGPTNTTTQPETSPTTTSPGG